MPAPADITVDSPLRQTILVVECKLTKESTPEGAARLRRNLLAQGFLSVPDEAFFMLAFPTGLYLWNQKGALDALPDFSAATQPILREYLGSRIADEKPWPRKESVELAISFWLGALAAYIRKPDPASDADQMIVKSGLYEQMKGGTVRTDAAP